MFLGKGTWNQPFHLAVAAVCVLKSLLTKFVGDIVCLFSF